MTWTDIKTSNSRQITDITVCEGGFCFYFSPGPNRGWPSGIATFMILFNQPFLSPMLESSASLCLSAITRRCELYHGGFITCKSFSLVAFWEEWKRKADCLRNRFLTVNKQDQINKREGWQKLRWRLLLRERRVDWFVSRVKSNGCDMSSWVRQKEAVIKS